jgi:hypothetical protein
LLQILRQEAYAAVVFIESKSSEVNKLKRELAKQLMDSRVMLIVLKKETYNLKAIEFE